MPQRHAKGISAKKLLTVHQKRGRSAGFKAFMPNRSI